MYNKTSKADLEETIGNELRMLKATALRESVNFLITPDLTGFMHHPVARGFAGLTMRLGQRYMLGQSVYRRCPRPQKSGSMESIVS